jgi:hypothetical protein
MDRTGTLFTEAREDQEYGVGYDDFYGTLEEEVVPIARARRHGGQYLRDNDTDLHGGGVLLP